MWSSVITGASLHAVVPERWPGRCLPNLEFVPLGGTLETITQLFVLLCRL